MYFHLVILSFNLFKKKNNAVPFEDIGNLDSLKILFFLYLNHWLPEKNIGIVSPIAFLLHWLPSLPCYLTHSWEIIL